ncbi:MAG: hypothetical protein HOI33_08140 [Rhodospirillaceae bacterium]|jgi:hypothetical protein|nr:hypothetical protein [Rhodospirillaceae bacterium]MBT5658799.1 hypothetical protein [Rhodospirillaceae bacterium]MBT5752664.1 hypothetical protein [Rhodospirillaceae bacterium]
MTVKKLTDTKAIEQIDTEKVIDALLDEIEKGNPGWRASLPADQKDAMARRNVLRGRV